MNLIKRLLSCSAIAAIAVATLSSCSKEYSADEPFPDVYTSTIFVSSNNRIVYALDRETGKRKWEFQTDAPVHATPVLFKGRLYIGTTGGTLYALDPQYGTQLAKREFHSGIYATPLGYEDRLIVPILSDTVFALNPDTLNGDPFWIRAVEGQIYASPTTHTIENRGEVGLFIATTGNKVYAIDVVEGDLLWTYTPTTAGAFYSSPCVVSDKFLYIGNDNGNLYSVNTTDGLQNWEFLTGGQVRSSPIAIGGNVLVGSNDRYFYSIDSTTGLERWKVQTSDRIVSSPAVDNQYVYFGCYDFNLYCVDIIDGTVHWKKLTFGLIQSSPLVYGGTVYVGSFDKNLYALDTADGGTKWVYNVNGQMECSPILDTVGGAAVPSISGSYRF